VFAQGGVYAAAAETTPLSEDPMRLQSAFFAALIMASTPLAAASLDGLAVEVRNESEPVLCAEKDNVSLNFTNPAVRSFRIEAAHPVYLSVGMRDNFEADWTACDIEGDPAYKAPSPPRKQTLMDGDELWIIGYTFGAFWRPSTAVVRIGDKLFRDIHMLQV
jgi:hypothetical protein